MPKFNILKEGTNEEMLVATRQKVDGFMKELFHDYEYAQLEDIYTFTFGTISVTVEVLPWHSEDVLVKVYSYLGNVQGEEDPKTVSSEVAQELMNLNASIAFGAFGITFEKQAMFSYALAGKNIDLNEFQAAVQMVAMTADEYDELIKNGELAVA